MMNEKTRNYSLEDYSTLNRVEKEIFDMVAPQNGVVMLQGKPGIGKTATVREIARKLNLQFMEFALTHIDAADLGGLPVIKHVEGMPQMSYAVNDWAILANSMPTLIFFDEANRPTEEVINALLKLFEGRIGLNFQFNSNVYMMAAGNLGMDEDGTTVTALDAAMNNRIIHVPFHLTYEEWVLNYARENVHSLIVSFLESDKAHYHMMMKEQDIYASPRSWTMLSDFLLFHGHTDIKKTRGVVFNHARKYVGDHSAGAFKMYLDDLLNVRIPSMKEIVREGSNLKSHLEKLNLIQLSYVVNSFDLKDIAGCKRRDIETFINFLTDDQTATMYARIMLAAVSVSKHSDEADYKSMNDLIYPYQAALNVRRKLSESLIDA